MRVQLQSHPSVCGFHTIYAVFYLFKFCQEEITGDQEIDVVCFLGDYM